MNRLIDLMLMLVLVVALGPALLAALAGVLAALAPVAIPAGFVGVVIWYFARPRAGEDGEE